ncbi:hypothetical protein BKM31_45440 [[Actinomadura] parvosata subsp. kistnae]|uniref:Uncharacterized protein n=1 Tax=[Actinomadura] parvosata subsp. kistnae TaxID=1909395 RepID=A0A1V0AC25_9ACTN|nr:hypothetical protein BKM31_45440 [Nonomuraea sp. ATCC 55076]
MMRGSLRRALLFIGYGIPVSAGDFDEVYVLELQLGFEIYLAGATLKAHLIATLQSRDPEMVQLLDAMGI